MSQQNKTGQSATATDEIIALKKNCRLVFVTEPDSAIEIKTSQIASWTGGDPIQCRENYKHSFNFVPEFKLFLRTNSDLSFSESNTVAMTR
jgi:phage/plasmid-associated DNA primase